MRVWRAGLIGALCLSFLSACLANSVAPASSSAQQSPTEKMHSGYGESDLVIIGEHRAGLAPAVLSVPETIELMAINGERAPLVLKQRDVKLALVPGEHRLEIRYFNLWDLDADSHEIVKSSPVVLKLSLKSGRQYQFQVPPVFESPAQAREYVRDFQPQVVTTTPAVMVAAPGLKMGDSGQAGQQRAEIQRAAATEVVSQAMGSGRENTESGVLGVSSIEQIKKLWIELSPSERQQFQQWVLESVDASGNK